MIWKTAIFNGEPTNWGYRDVVLLKWLITDTSVQTQFVQETLLRTFISQLFQQDQQSEEFFVQLFF